MSLLLRSFAAPIAVAFVGAGVSVVALMMVGDLVIVSPYALATRASVLGTGAFSDPGTVTSGTIATLLAAAAGLTLALIAATAAHLDRRDIRA